MFRKKGKVSGDGICHDEGPVRTRPCDVAFQSPGTGIEVRDERARRYLSAMAQLTWRVTYPRHLIPEQKTSFLQAPPRTYSTEVTAALPHAHGRLAKPM